MATTTLTIDEELLGATSISAAEEARDLDYIDCPFLQCQAMVHGEGEPHKSSGARWIEAFGVGSHSEPTRQQTGYEQMNLSFKSTIKPLTLTPDEVVFPVGISLVEEEMNGGELQTISVAAQRTKKVVAEAKRRFEQYMFQGPDIDAKVAAFTGFGHLNGIDTDADGILEEDAHGSQTNTYGGFNKGSYQNVQGAQNNSYDIGGSFNSGGLDGLISTIIDCEKRSEGSLDGMHVFGSTAAVRNYKMTLQPQERYMSSDTLDGTRMALAVHGKPLYIEHYMPNSGTNTTASEASFILLDFNAIYFMWSKVIRNGYFSLSDWVPLGNGYNVRVAQVVVRGQLWVSSWGSSAVLVNGDTF
mgnify:CR=1 FL=1